MLGQLQLPSISAAQSSDGRQTDKHLLEHNSIAFEAW